MVCHTRHVSPCDIRSKLAVPIRIKDNWHELPTRRIVHMIVDYWTPPSDCKHAPTPLSFCRQHACCASFEECPRGSADSYSWHPPSKSDILPYRPDYPALYAPECDNRPSDGVRSKSKALWDICESGPELEELCGYLMTGPLRTMRDIPSSCESSEAQLELRQIVLAKGADGKPLMKKCLCRMVASPPDDNPSALNPILALQTRWTLECMHCDREISLEEMFKWNGRSTSEARLSVRIATGSLPPPSSR